MSEIIIREPRSREQIDNGILEMTTLAAFINQKMTEMDSLTKKVENSDSAIENVVLFAYLESLKVFIDEKEKKTLDLLGFKTMEDVKKWENTFGDLYYHED